LDTLHSFQGYRFEELPLDVRTAILADRYLTGQEVRRRGKPGGGREGWSPAMKAIAQVAITDHARARMLENGSDPAKVAAFLARLNA
jgi:hypothetical protein